MNLELAGKRAIITGSSSGIGAQIARTLAGEGAEVVIHGRNRDRTECVQKEILDLVGKAHAVMGDLYPDADAARIVTEATAAMGGIDIVVNNAGGADGVPASWDTTAMAGWLMNFQQNLFSSVRVTRAALPILKRNGWGRIIQIATGWAMQPAPVAVDYAAAKAAIVNTTVSLAKGLAGTNVTVNTVSPGPILTPALERTARGIAADQGWGEEWTEIEAKFVQNIVPNPAGRVGRVEDIANTVAFLASPLAGYINGANVRVDGGYVSATN